VWTILQRAGVAVAPARSALTWRRFLRSQAQVVLAVDFLHRGHGVAQAVVRPGCDRDRDPPGPRAGCDRAAEGIGVLHTPVRAPRANAYAERWVGTVRRELLDRMLIFARRHLASVLTEFAEHDNIHRPHRALGRRHHSDPANQRLSCRLGRWCDGIGWVG
jgi:putative transposase